MRAEDHRLGRIEGLLAATGRAVVEPVHHFHARARRHDLRLHVGVDLFPPVVVARDVEQHLRLPVRIERAVDGGRRPRVPVRPQRDDRGLTVERLRRADLPVRVSRRHLEVRVPGRVETHAVGGCSAGERQPDPRRVDDRRARALWLEVMHVQTDGGAARREIREPVRQQAGLRAGSRASERGLPVDSRPQRDGRGKDERAAHVVDRGTPSQELDAPHPVVVGELADLEGDHVLVDVIRQRVGLTLHVDVWFPEGPPIRMHRRERRRWSRRRCAGGGAAADPGGDRRDLRGGQAALVDEDAGARAAGEPRGHLLRLHRGRDGARPRPDFFIRRERHRRDESTMVRALLSMARLTVRAQEGLHVAVVGRRARLRGGPRLRHDDGCHRRQQREKQDPRPGGHGLRLSAQLDDDHADVVGWRREVDDVLLDRVVDPPG